MKKLSSIQRALLAGCSGQALLCGAGFVSIVHDGFGPCGPSGEFPWWLILIHEPGIWVSEILPPEHPFLRFVIMLATTTTLLSLAAFGIISLAKSGKVLRREG